MSSPAAVPLSPCAVRVWRQNLTSLTPARLRIIETTLNRVRRANVAGDFVEFGVALGGSAILIASAVDGDRRFLGFDVFGMAPARGEIRLAEDGTGRKLPDLYECVRRAFERFGLTADGERIILHRGHFQRALETQSARAVAFAHIDCDWYEPVQSFLFALGKRLSPGGVVVLDDYNEGGGCRRAVDAFLDEHDAFRLIRSGPSAVLQRD